MSLIMMIIIIMMSMMLQMTMPVTMIKMHHCPWPPTKNYDENHNEANDDDDYPMAMTMIKMHHCP